MVSSKVYPDLERAPGKADNWVEKSGGLPDYIERVAKHIHYEGGKDISTAISMAISQVKKWAAEGKAKAVQAIAQWEALKAKNKGRQAIKMSADRITAGVLELSIVEDKTGRLPPPAPWEKRSEIVRLQAKVKAGAATAADRKRLARLVGSKEKKPPVALAAKRGPYTSHVKHTKQFGKTKGNLQRPASWQHPYQPKNQIAGALKAKHLSNADLDSSGHPKAGKGDAVKKPLPASAAIAGTGRKEQHTGAEAARKATAPKGPKQEKKSPGSATLRARRRALAAKVAAKTATPAERKELNSVISSLKKVARS